MDRALLFTAFALIALRTDRLVSGNSVTAMINDSVQLTMNKNCSGTVYLKTGDNSVTVAERADGVWISAEGYFGRIQHRSVTSVVLTNVTYNDNGLHEFSCAGAVVSRTLLNVVPTVDIMLSEEGVEIRRYSLTAQPVRWLRDREEFTNDTLTLKSSSLEDQAKFTSYDGKTAVRVWVNKRDPEQITSTPSPSVSSLQPAYTAPL